MVVPKILLVLIFFQNSNPHFTDECHGERRALHVIIRCTAGEPNHDYQIAILLTSLVPSGKFTL